MATISINIPPLLDLPPEILDRIFQHITPFCLDSRLVCKAFDVAGKRRGRASFESKLFIFMHNYILLTPRRARSLHAAGGILAYTQYLVIRLHDPSSPNLILKLAHIVTHLGRLTTVHFLCRIDGLSVSTEMLQALTMVIENIPSSHLVCGGYLPLLTTPKDLESLELFVESSNSIHMLQTTKQDRLRTLSVDFGTENPRAFERPFWLTLEKVNYSSLTSLQLTFPLDQSNLDKPNALAIFLQQLPKLQLLYLRHRMLNEQWCLAILVTAFGKLHDIRAIGLEPFEAHNSDILRTVDPSKSFAYLGKSADQTVQFYHPASGEIADMTTLNFDDVRWLLKASGAWAVAIWFESQLMSREGGRIV